MPRTQLYASGFNAWHQLDFELSKSPETTESEYVEPDDISRFRLVLEDEVGIEIPWIGLTCTLVRTSAGFRVAGTADEVARRWLENGDTFSDGKVGMAGNGKMVVAGDKVSEYKSWKDFPNKPASSWDLGNIKQLRAGQTHFIALVDNQVWSWGDVRYSDCLGRVVSTTDQDSTPASEPHPIIDLFDLPTGPITKIDSGGYVNAAVTEGHDIYMWGHGVSDLTLEPTPLDLQEKDFLDVGVGEDHRIVLATDGTVWVTGQNGNGQLGSGIELKIVEGWKEVQLELPRGMGVVGVAAGPKCSFLVAQEVVL